METLPLTSLDRGQIQCANILFDGLFTSCLLQVLFRNIINVIQCGFIANKSCQTNLLQISLKKGNYVAELLLRHLACMAEALMYEYIILMYLTTEILTKRLML